MEMNIQSAFIKPFERTETDIISPMFPEDWHFDFAAFVDLNLDKSYFKGFTLVFESQPVGFGNLVTFGKSVWLGNIVVDEKHRNKGWGKLITDHLVKEAQKTGVVTFNLIATELGEYVYKKMGWEREVMYGFFRPTEKTSELEYKRQTTRAKEKDLDQISALDFAITGEDRKELLANYLEGIHLIIDEAGKLKGFFVETLGNGLIVAAHEEIGFELQKRIINNRRNGVLPLSNEAGVNFLLANGYEKFSELPRMVRGEKTAWHPVNIFNRGTGYAG